MLRLYTFHRSTAAFRIRIALLYKKIPHELVFINLNAGEQHSEEYKRQNPQKRVPTLVDGNINIGQSAAIFDYLEEKYPNLPLLPADTALRAQIRSFSHIIISDMHPLMNKSSVKPYLIKQGFTEQQVLQWDHHWLKEGFNALETILQLNSRRGERGEFCFGHTPTFADICLIPQVYNAHKFKFPMKPCYPNLQRIYEHCLSLDYFEKAKPENQLDYREEVTPPTFTISGIFNRFK